VARLTTHALLLLSAASTIIGCFRAMPVASVDLAIALATPENRAKRTATAGVVDPNETGSSLTLTLDAALERAIATDPVLAELHAKTNAEAARIAVADDLENPELRLTNVNFRDGGEASELTLRVRPPLPGEVQARGEIARAGFEQASADAARARQLLATRVRKHFELSLLHRDAAALAAEAAVLESRELVLLERELARGVVTRGDVAERALDAAGTRRECDQAARRLAASREMLRELLDLPATTRVVLVGEPAIPAALEAVDGDDGELLERALRARPELRDAGASIDAARAETWLARAEQWPMLSFVQVGYDFQPSGAEAWEAGVAIDVPLFNWNRDGVRAAEADLLVVRRGFEGVVREIAGEVQTSLVRARDAASDLSRFRDGPSRAAASARRSAESGRSLGQVSEGDLIEAKRRDIEARLTELDLAEDYIVAFAELGAAVGDLAAEDAVER
jgi:cobalt-zinc-cadmium efflux system outer membrane protein